MTKEILHNALPNATVENINKYFDKLVLAMAAYDINTPKRQAAFLAQLAHESGSFRYSEEIASGIKYEGRKDLGNIYPGDGIKFKGRGAIQITGRYNYHLVSKALQHDFINNPRDLSKPGPAAFSAAWFWKIKGLNELADKDEFLTISKRINGVNRKSGLPNGWDDRVKHWERFKKVLNVV